MENVVAAFMNSHSVPGMSVAVAHSGQVLYEQGFGWADRDNQERVTPKHLFRIASVSKPITSVALFTLIERGRIHLNDLIIGPDGILRFDFGKPPYKQYVADLRLKNLMTHTGGGWQNNADDPMFRSPAMTHRQLIEWTLATAPLTYAPGVHYAYSNFGYCILGRVIEKVTSRRYDEFVRESVLKPCGVTGMRISGNTRAERAPNEVVYYGTENPYNMNVRRMDSHGGWLATAADLVRFASHVDGHAPERNILQPASIREMTAATSANPGYAKGWSVNSVPNWWHTGSLPGTTSIMVRTASGFCWAALLNTREMPDTGGALDRMMWDMVRQAKSWKP
jgi:CubicO group peptidase (beta-lactamase class C family)